MPTDRPHRVVVLAQDGAYPFELGIPARVFGAADEPYEVLVCTPTGRPIATNAGFRVTPDHGPEVLEQADTVIVTPVDPARLRRELAPDVARAMARIRPGARIASICTGGFTLAAAGLLNGRRATTHWQCADLFADWYPHIEVDENVLFVGDEHVITSAGAASGIDLCLHLLRADHGEQAAARAARRCVVAPFREGGQAQFVERPVPRANDASTGAVRAWALGHLAEPLTVADLARRAHMSERTFVRHFTAETGMAPRRWVTQQRLRAALELLETTDLGIDAVAAQVGYATATSLRNHLGDLLGIAPSTYRRSFRAQDERRSA